ncbi:hypothetical protein [Massilia sp. Mn16-1_5]|uniref:hypothetical protein n=1 Tax=Massilia sp. Mn16-1_5 TaxID=2079199 RepID=UPI00109E440F|nr:hypothetical protein [Massilia sp. Mn16-1_5]THC40001.1 hypothetical protein C2862_22610 [Massilia sp. Mn16-1_5]
MSLPDLAFQIVYGRLAWGIVLLALVAALIPPGWRLGRRVLGAAAAGVALLMALPGSLSPAWGLGLAFQYPSGLLVGCCLLGLHARWRKEPVPVMMPVSLAAPLAIAGAALYLDAMGLLAQGYYYAAFGPVGAPLLALLGVAGCALAIARGQGRGHALVLLGALLLYTLLRLPSGNLWDAILDPLLWGWAVVALVRHGLRRYARSKRRGGEADQGLTPELQPVDLQPLFAAGGIEHLSSSKEQVSGKQ